MLSENKGFTLIELLVVIAIIGLLSGIVIASLNSARQKGRIAAIKGSVQQLMTQGQLYLSDHTSYAAATSSPRNSCYATTTLLANTVFSDQTTSQMISNIDDNNAAPIACSISSSGLSFAIVASLGNGKNLCADSNSTKIESATVDASNGLCQTTTTSAPAYINKGGKISPSPLTVQSGTTVLFNYTGPNGSISIDCSPGGPSFSIDANNTLYSYVFSGSATYTCGRSGGGGPSSQIIVQ